MSAPIIQSQDCCVQCPDVPSGSQIPGPAGADGAPGAAGAAGVDAFTTTTNNFTMPAVSGSVTVDVAVSTWAGIGMTVYVENAGYFLVDSLPSPTQMTLINLGYDGNAAPATVITSASKVSPAGKKGADGSSGSTPTLNDISPTTTRGDLIVDNGANSPDPSDVRLAAGANGKVLHADSTQPTGLRWDKVDLTSSSEVTGVLPATNGGNSDRLPLAGGTLTGDLRQNKADPKQWIQDSAGPVDEKKWCWEATASAIKLLAVNDAESVFTPALTIVRSGTTPGDMEIAAPLSLDSALSIQDYLQFIQEINTTVADGVNNNVNLGSKVFIKLQPGPTSDFQIRGITLGFNGRIIILVNDTGANMTLAHESGTSTALNRIITTTGSNVVCKVGLLIYDIDSQRWRLLFYA